MKCFNPFCSKPGYIYKTRQGLDKHLSNNKTCMVYMKQLVLNQTTPNIVFKHKLVGMTGNMNANDSLSNKRLCDINLSLFNSMQKNSLDNNISYELQNMLDDNFDTNSYSSEESSASVESINSDATMPNIDAPILGNIYTTEQKVYHQTNEAT